MKYDLEYTNLTYLESISEGNNEIMVELIEIFIDQIPDFTSGMLKYYENKEWKGLAALAHKAKSSVLSLGMTHLGEVDLKNLELLAKQQYLKELEELNTPQAEVEAKKIEENLNTYYSDRLEWINQNNSLDTINKTINFFILQCENASGELKNVLKKLS